MNVLIIGCGYVGLALGELLAIRGNTVFGLRRSNAADSALLNAGIRPIHADITRPETFDSLPATLDAVVNLVSSSKGGAEQYREVYLKGTESLIGHFSKIHLRRYVHVSSTSVYAQNDGSTVSESSPALAAGDTSRLLRETEDLLLHSHRNTHFPAIILRASGIYGPGRGHLFRQFLRGEARSIGDGSRYINMIHRDDLASALACTLDHGEPGQIYNATDDASVQERDYFEWLCHQLNRPYPPPADPEVTSKRKRGLTSKRVQNLKLRALGWNPAYPTYREGYAEDVEAALQDVPSHPKATD
jgi:nucleoside-diphosphate-sugar epimerase